MLSESEGTEARGGGAEYSDSEQIPTSTENESAGEAGMFTDGESSDSADSWSDVATKGRESGEKYERFWLSI